jgi:hypothetical protein
MNTKTTWRNVAVLLVLTNLMFWVWSQGFLREVGFGPKSVQEPQRLKEQIQPQALAIQNAASQDSNPQDPK